MCAVMAKFLGPLWCMYALFHTLKANGVLHDGAMRVQGLYPAAN